MAKPRAKRHHLVSEFYLKGFADDNDKLLCAPRTGGREYPTNVKNATVQSNFNTVIARDGSKSDVFERWMGEVETGAAPVLRSLVERNQPPAVGDDRLAFAGWVALQHLRGEAQRGMISQLDALLQAAQNTGATDARDEQMHHAVQEAPSASEADPHLHLQIVRDLMPMIGAWIMASPWQVLHLIDGYLVVGDHPVYMAPDREVSQDRGIGLVNAFLAMPLSRRSLLLVKTSRPGRGLPDFVGDADANVVRFANLTAILSARRYVFRHPNDPLPEPMTNFPPPEEAEFAFEQAKPVRHR